MPAVARNPKPQPRSPIPWSITYGDYELIVDRRALTYRLTETKTGTVWAVDLSLGWVALKERETHRVTRYAFGETRVISVSEKAGPQGKRILFGLDIDGIPIDLYLICSQREIQMVVEASRDSKTHTVEEFFLLPGLCAIPENDKDYLVIPNQEGAIVFACDAPEHPIDLPIWDVDLGVTMPFIGAVRGVSALALITDSIYGAFDLSRTENGATLNTRYERDPERRRLDLRVLPLPGGDYIAVASAYREKIIADNNHVTLRKKLRERPTLEALIGGAFFLEKHDERAIEPALREEHGFKQAIWYTQKPQSERDAVALVHKTTPQENRWDNLERYLHRVQEIRTQFPIVGSGKIGDWAAVSLDFWRFKFGKRLIWRSIPLIPVVYHDSVFSASPLDYPREIYFLRALLYLQTPFFGKDKSSFTSQYALLGPLNELTFTAFLTAHRFLTPDFLVEEAIYSDRTRIIINLNAADDYKTDELTLPPLGFYVRHAQMEAHDALRIGDKTFSTRAWRIRRARDGKPLEQSEDIERQEFLMP